MAEDPRYQVSVVVPAHNRAHLLPMTLAAAFAQRTEVRYEVIVVDDCSTDRTASVAEQLGARVVRLKTNVGPGASRDAGIAAATAEWVAFLDSDDRWSPDHLTTLWSARADLGFVATSLVSRSEGRTRVVGSPLPWSRTLRRPSAVLGPENIIPTSATMAKRQLIREVGGFGPGRHAEDLELWMRVLTLTRGRVLSRITGSYQAHDGQLSRTAAMAEGAPLALQRLVEDGLLPAGRARRLRSIERWDRRGSGPGALLGLVAPLARREIQPTALVAVIASRALCRHRWRLQPRRTRTALPLPAGTRPTVAVTT